MSKQDKQHEYLLQDDSRCVRDIENWKPSGLSPEEIEEITAQAFAEFDAAIDRAYGKA